jgi:HK97 gp10 family phage protein
MATVDGLDTLNRRLDLLAAVSKGETMFRAAVSGMLLIINAAKRNAPYITGNLRRSLHVGGAANLTPDFSTAEKYHDLGSGSISGKSATAIGGTDVEYAPAVEFGAEGRAANPYLRPAFDANKEAATVEVGAAYKILIEAAARG